MTGDRRGGGLQNPGGLRKTAQVEQKSGETVLLPGRNRGRRKGAWRDQEGARKGASRMGDWSSAGACQAGKNGHSRHPPKVEERTGEREYTGRGRSPDGHQRRGELVSPGCWPGPRSAGPDPCEGAGRRKGDHDICNGPTITNVRIALSAEGRRLRPGQDGTGRIGFECPGRGIS